MAESVANLCIPSWQVYRPRAGCDKAPLALDAGPQGIGQSRIPLVQAVFSVVESLWK